jgi:hypothetical protein
VGARIGERADHAEELHHRARPAVQQQQRGGVGLRRAYVQEVDLLAVDGRRELRELVDAGFGLAPVEAVTPVPREALDGRDRHPVVGAGAGDLVGPPRRVESRGEVVEVGLRDRHLERLDLCVCHASTVRRLPVSFCPQVPAE